MQHATCAGYRGQETRKLLVSVRHQHPARALFVAGVGRSTGPFVLSPFRFPLDESKTDNSDRRDMSYKRWTPQEILAFDKPTDSTLNAASACFLASMYRNVLLGPYQTSDTELGRYRCAACYKTYWP